MLAFVDADVLASPMTRTVLMLSSFAKGSRFTLRWSLSAEVEADSALRPGQTPVSELRGRFLWGERVLVPDATQTAEAALSDTSQTDRHILAAAKAADIRVLITRNVHDFGRDDLADLQVDAVHPDLFLSHMVDQAGYREALEAMSEGRDRPPNTPEDLHVALGAGHPLLFQAMRGAYPGAEALPPTSDPPAESFRGNHCLICGKMLSDPESLSLGVGPECRLR